MQIKEMNLEALDEALLAVMDGDKDMLNEVTKLYALIDNAQRRGLEEGEGLGYVDGYWKGHEHGFSEGYEKSAEVFRGCEQPDVERQPVNPDCILLPNYDAGVPTL